MNSLTVSSNAQPLKGCTNFKLHKLARLVGRRYDAQLAQVGLTTAQYALMNHVHYLGPMRPVDLSQAMGLTPSTLTRNVQPLIAQGWLYMQAGADARSRQIGLTEQGLSKRAEAQKSWRKAQQDMNTLLGVEQAAQLHGLLDACTKALTESMADEPVL
ncbi:winged helix-turn-helix transcriptional regulator [Lampropedia puyangensis]|uniref:Winged helix-turn-helix transcriptional regulator n=1 Tax=Lampropedia puyangensis TaxID=1330072 RepID=A0A4S8F2F3_9BURK|nr:MarR family winged helix-turn-helix transcriptional regulator [Lampropedia puyangensis]THU00274.1 winged helix-turn-helix transcriptional regulator [Lampropedia puyangensis]